MHKLSLGSFCLAMAAICGGCVVSADVADTPPSMGTLTVDWTIGGYADSLACWDLGADSMDLIVYDAAGVVTEQQAACEDFSLSVHLAPGGYSADTALIDAYGRDVTSVLALDGLDVSRGLETVIDVDF
jgi:hypothetical protein